jgi:hypothetical protein
MTESENDLALRLAIASLMENGHWPRFEAAIRERRETWIKDIGSPAIYQHHAELSHTVARIAECDWLLELCESSRPKSDSSSVIQ